MTTNKNKLTIYKLIIVFLIILAIVFLTLWLHYMNENKSITKVQVKHCKDVTTQEWQEACWDNNSKEQEGKIRVGEQNIFTLSSMEERAPLCYYADDWDACIQDKVYRKYKITNITITQIYNDYNCDKVNDEGILELKTCRKLYNLSELNWKISFINYYLEIENDDFYNDYQFKYKIDYQYLAYCRQNVTKEVCD